MTTKPFGMAPEPLKFEEYSDFQKKCYRALTNIYLSVGGVQYTNTWKEVYGSPVFQYLLEYKMNLSKQLLTGGKYNVNEVSMKLGYSTASHFIAAFKRRFGITPKQYIMHKS